LDYKFIPFGNAYYNEGMDELGCPGSKFYNRNEGTPCWQTNCGDVNFQPEECFAGMILWLIHVIVFNIGITAVFFSGPQRAGDPLCQHGASECLGDRYEACASIGLSNSVSPNQTAVYVYCLEVCEMPCLCLCAR
jgi:hypothetical protein